MSTQPGTRRDEQQVSRWALGVIAFTGTIMAMMGVFQIMGWLVAILNEDFFVVAANYTFDLDVTIWGWIHLTIGVIGVLVGFGLFARATWAGVAAIIIAFLSALANFFFIPYYPIWALVVIALDVWLIWAVTRPGAITT